MRQSIILKKVRVHNLKAVDLTLETGKLIVFTGVSGSGKSSMAFDTIYKDGQRRYVESLSTFARRYLGDLGRPDAEHISGLSPTISVEQKTSGRNPRSTVGTMTEVYDYLRVLFARCATPHCPVSGECVMPQSQKAIVSSVQAMKEDRLIIYAPFVKGKKGELKDEFEELRKRGFIRARVDGNIIDLDEEISLDGRVAHTIDVVVDRMKQGDKRITESVMMALEVGKGTCLVNEKLFSTHAFSPKSGLSYAPLEPHDFSFNSPAGMCNHCQGLGIVEDFDLNLVIDPDLSIGEDCCSIASSIETVRYGNIYRNLGRLYNFRLSTPWKKLTDEAKHIFLYGTEKKWTRMSFVHPITKKRWQDYVQWRGVIFEAKERYAKATSEHYKKHMRELMRRQDCPSCKGVRIKAYPAAAKLHGKTIGDVASMSIEKAHEFLENLPPNPVGEELIKEIKERLRFLLDVGLGYLSLDRTSPTLSGGEAQRVRLAAQIGCGLVGVTYVLDEPSIGLHPRDNNKLLQTLQTLRDRGNTVIVVEHDEETMRAADHLVEFGPGAGARGGEIVVSGTIDDLLKNKKSLTGAYLSGRKKIPIPKKRRKPEGKIRIKNATHNNLQNITVDFPKGVLIGVTGVSGSGKSSLVLETLLPQIQEEAIAIDQRPIGRNPRSNPATYIKLFDEIRILYTLLPESQARGYKPGRFSFNVQDGSCSHCRGMGEIKIDMDFMEDAWVECEACKGHRFDHETLTVRYKGKSIYDVLEMEVEEAAIFFENHPKISRKLETLKEVGLGYLKLGQSSTTLSGGEAQRIKLAKELSRPERAFYLLDEPTTGLHFHDIEHLLQVLHRLVDQGNTVLVIEHNIDVIKSCDHLIDLGPEGGEKGGQLVATGTPEKLAKMDTPTGYALREHGHYKPAKSADSELEYIEVEGATQNNLKSATAQIPRGKITVCTGPSGSGKSSFAFETVYAEGQRRYTESLSPYARQFVQQMAKPKVEKVDGLLPAVAIEQKAHAGNPRSTVGTLTEIYDYLRLLWARVGIPHCPETGEVIKAISAEHVIERILAMSGRIAIMKPLQTRDFPNLVEQLKRQGFLRIRLNGEMYELDGEIPYSSRRKNKLFLIVDRLKVDPNARSRIAEAIEACGDQVVVLHNDKETFYNLSFSVESTGKSYPPITPKSFAFNTPDGMCEGCQGLGCKTCDDERIGSLARHVTINDLSLGKLCQLPTKDALKFLEKITLDSVDQKLLEETYRQLLSRLRFLNEVGLHYLSLNRGAPTLSNGEAQRIRLARQLGSGLTGILYVLDEPTVGLHPHDNAMLSGALKKLKDLDNTIVMVEHDPLTLKDADYFLDFGPKAGRLGGEIMARGTLKELKKNPKSLTGAYLSGKKKIAIPKRRKPTDYFPIKKAKTHNLKNISTRFPYTAFSCITGLSGSGKSSLMQEVIKQAPIPTIVLDQNPIGHTARADVGTYTDIFPHIRNLYAALPPAVSKGLLPRHFSFNHRKGMCSQCWGMGVRKIEMHFLPPVEITCDQCHGMRLNPLSLEVDYKGKHFGHLFSMTVEEAKEFFSAFPKITRRLNTLISVGLGYLQLGQKIQTLSGGEAQRLKLSRELAKRTKQKTLYLLDEPTTGLHPDDINLLLSVLQKLVDKGHTLIVVEHNLDLIKCADYIVDLGPESGQNGGQIVASGTPEEIAKSGSHTGLYIKNTLKI